jgi:preprotein translocase subunit SecA
MYPRLAGMTGTATAAAKEFYNTYSLLVHVIPTHNKMIREDHTDIIFTNRKSKIDAIINEVIQASRIGRPVLLGTASVEESEEISALIEENGLKCEVLNAKNDEMEAHLISLAGCSNAVTVSTNMAGRGIDIKLGGENPSDKAKVVSVGGLLVIGTNRHESSRVDKQLRGRSGRQGDPGDSKFFISIEDELFIKYNFNDLISTRILEESESVIVTDTKILRESNRLQRIVEGLHYDIRDSLSKYTVMLQEQGEYIRRMRLKILHSKSDESLFFQSQFPDRYGRYCHKYSPSLVNDAEKQLCLRVINQSWADYLDNMSYVKDSIHILKMSGMDPLFEYNKVLFESFNELKSNIKDQISELLETIEIDENGVNLDQIGLPKPGSTWTYIVSNTADQLNLFPFLESLTKIAKKRWFE